jgi:hypothetical protein
MKRSVLVLGEDVGVDAAEADGEVASGWGAWASTVDALSVHAHAKASIGKTRILDRSDMGNLHVDLYLYRMPRTISAA